MAGIVKAAQNPQGEGGQTSGGLRISLFGPITVSAGGTPVPIASKKSRALLGYPGAPRGHPCRTRNPYRAVWGDRSEDQARASLRQALSRLRAELGEVARDALAAGPETIALVAGSARIDAREMELLAASEDLQSVRAAADLFGGELMEGLAIPEPGFEEWLASERERFRRIVCGIHTRLMKSAELNGKLEEALTVGLKLISLDPIQEHVHRALMRLYAAQGRHDAALSQYERCRQELLRQLGVRPDLETEELARAIRASRRVGPASTSASAGTRKRSRQNGPDGWTVPRSLCCPSRI